MSDDATCAGATALVSVRAYSAALEGRGGALQREIVRVTIHVCHCFCFSSVILSTSGEKE